MRLSRDVIYYWLIKKFAVSFEKKSDPDIGFMRPVFYETDLDIAGTVVIIDADGLKSLIESRNHGAESLFLCTEKPNRSLKMIDGTVMVIKSNLSALSLFNYLQDIYNRFDQWDERLNQIYYENGSFQDLIDSCQSILTEPILLIDKKFHYTAYSKSIEELTSAAFMDENKNSLPEVVNDFITDSSFQSLYDLPDIFDYAMVSPSGTDEMICKNVFDHNGYVGRFIIQLSNGSEEIAKTYVRTILAHLFTTADKLYQKYQSFNLKEVALNSLREPLLNMLQNEQSSDEQWQKVAFENNWKTTDNLQLVQFRSNTRYAKNVYTDYLSSEIENQWQGCVCLNYRERLLMLINLDQFNSVNDKNFYRQLPYFLRDSLLVAGLSRVFGDMGDLRAAYHQTEIALDFGTCDQPMFWTYRFDDYAFHYLLKNSPGIFAMHQVCSEKLLTLRQYDAEKHTEYYKTLLTFFDCRLNAAAAAKRLYIHRSSFLNRLERIEKLFNIDFNSNNELLYLGLSMLIIERN
ncbi:PucR family transcriptional regulator [Acetobacterium wieringae]|nr:helix-turn-helix domain-containing protein [Acetobacterium wieringae]URN85501.1 helix-turn-helix domain-containing protein [Acetobacterium wieringae]